VRVAIDESRPGKLGDQVQRFAQPRGPGDDQPRKIAIGDGTGARANQLVIPGGWEGVTGEETW